MKEQWPWSTVTVDNWNREVGSPWPLTLKTTLDFKLGNQNGIAGTGTLSVFDFIEGKDRFISSLGIMTKPIDFQAGLEWQCVGSGHEPAI